MTRGGVEVVMLALGSGCKCRLSLAERFDFTETIINGLLTDSYPSPISEWHVIIKLHLVAGSKAPNPAPWKNCLPQNGSLVPQGVGTAVLGSLSIVSEMLNYESTDFSLRLFCVFPFQCLTTQSLLAFQALDFIR